MLAGLIRDDERRVAGRHSRAERPAGRRHDCSRTRTTETEQTDIILTLTPHIIRVLDLNEADLRPFRVGRETVTLIDLPVADSAASRRSRPNRATPAAGAGSRRRPIRRPRRRPARFCRRDRVRDVAIRPSGRDRPAEAGRYVFATFAPEPLQPLDEPSVAALDGLERRRAGSGRPPPAPRQSAPSPIAGRGCRAAGRAAASGR